MDQIIGALIRPAIWHGLYLPPDAWVTKGGGCFMGCVRSMGDSLTRQQQSDYE